MAPVWVKVSNAPISTENGGHGDRQSPGCPRSNVAARGPDQGAVPLPGLACNQRVPGSNPGARPDGQAGPPPERGSPTPETRPAIAVDLETVVPFTRLWLAGATIQRRRP